MKRDLAERLALSVDGVTAVRNDITIARGSLAAGRDVTE
jgi:osmotically-inducible protein OsmY